MSSGTAGTLEDLSVNCQRTCILSRRGTLSAIATGLVGSLAGCSLEASFPDADVIAGPNGDAVFEPAELTVEVGDTVAWGFASAGHNVSCRSEDSKRVELPAEAESFASYGPDESPQGSLVPRGGTYERTFEAAGAYVYVCIPHVSRGMVGMIHVE
jgi:plastocyanin